jgi:hypothetical protein
MFNCMPQLSTTEKCSFYVPLLFNHKHVDGILVIPIQVTVAKDHLDLRAKFFSQCSWLELVLKDFKLMWDFMWIIEHKQVHEEVPKQVKELKERDILSWPQHTVHWVSIEQISHDLANMLAMVHTS